MYSLKEVSINFGPYKAVIAKRQVLEHIGGVYRTFGDHKFVEKEPEGYKKIFWFFYRKIDNKKEDQG